MNSERLIGRDGGIMWKDKFNFCHQPFDKTISVENGDVLNHGPGGPVGSRLVTIMAFKENFPFRMFITFSISNGFTLSKTSLHIFQQD